MDNWIATFIIVALIMSIIVIAFDFWPWNDKW